MRSRKRCLAVLVLLIQSLTLLPPAVTSSFAATADKSEILFSYTGDSNYDSEWTNQSGEVAIAAVDGIEGNVLKVNQGTLHAMINRNDPVTEGNVVVSYDLRTDTNSGYAYIVAASDFNTALATNVETLEGRFGALLYNTSTVGIPNSANTLTVNSYSAEVGVKIWQHVDLWLDFNTYKSELYIDGRHIVTEELNSAFNAFCGFGFISDKSSNSYYIDNVYIGYAPVGSTASFEFCQGTPPQVKTACYAELIHEPLGHIYTDTNVNVKAEFKNTKSVPHEITYEYTAITEDGRVAYTEQNTIALASGEKKTADINFEADTYGFYDSFLTVTDPISGGQGGRVTRFSVVRTREDGAKSRIIGLNSHYQVNRGTAEVDRMQKLFSDIGIQQMREGIPWAQYESTRGSFALASQHVKMLKAFKENNQNLHFILGHESLARNIPFPKTAAELDAWKLYVDKIVQEVAAYGVRDFELWNEVDLKWAQGGCTAEEYVNLMKVTYPIVHKYVPDARLFVFSCARNYTNFIEECLAIEGCIDNFDGISYHPYDSTSRPEEDNGSFTENSYHEYIEEIDSLVKKWNLQDKVLVISEFGYTTSGAYMTDVAQAQWVVRASAMAYDHVEYLDWFMNIEKIDQAASSDAEYHFGWLRAWEKMEINYEAKPVIAAVANYNAIITEDAESLGNQEILNGEGRMYKYKNDGKDIYMLWKVRDSAPVSIDVGAQEATVYDMYGNAHTQKTDNGILYLYVDESPQYVTGNFTNCEEVTATAFSLEGDALEAIKGELLKIIVNKDTKNDDDYTVDVSLPMGAEIADNTGFVNGKCTLSVKLGDDFQNGTPAKVSVKDRNGNTVLYRELDINIVNSADVNFEIQYNKSGRWKGALQLKNTSDKSISGSLNISYPKELSAAVPSVKIDTIIPNMTRLVEFNIPISVTTDFIEFKGEVVLANGETYALEESSYFTALLPVDEMPKIDGVVEKGEYNESMPLVFDKERMVVGVNGLVGGFQWDGVKDLSAKGYINYDKDYFYLAMQVEDDIMGSNDERKRVWANDSIQFSFAEAREKNAGYTEIGIGVVDGKPEIARYYYMGEKANIVFHDSIGAKDGFEEDTELMISREGTVTTYELKIPWVDIYPTRDPFAMDNVFFSVIINENDLAGREGWLEFSPGIGYFKNPADFTSVMVMK